MCSTLRNRFGIPGAISVIALVFAMFGGAYAASNSSGGGKATASAKAKRGPKGATGPAGPAGAKGDAGAAGANGTNGSGGVSATTESFNGAAHGCTEGGVVVKSASPETVVCNGKKGTHGTNGTNGSPWTAGGTLPVGSTETGSWSFRERTAEYVFAFAPVSFAIPLAGEIDETHVHYETEENFGTFCTGTAANPTAPSGELCVYQFFAEGQAAFAGIFSDLSEAGLARGAGAAGAFIRFTDLPNLEEGGKAAGTFAVTG